MSYSIGTLCDARCREENKYILLELLLGFYYPEKKLSWHTSRVGTKVFNLRWSPDKKNYYSAAHFTRTCLSRIIPVLVNSVTNPYIDKQIICDWIPDNRDKVFCINYSNKHKGGLHITLSKKVKSIEYSEEMVWPDSIYDSMLIKQGCSRRFIKSFSLVDSGGNFPQYVKQMKDVDTKDWDIGILLLSRLDYQFTGNDKEFSMLDTDMDFNEFSAEYPNKSGCFVTDEVLEDV